MNHSYLNKVQDEFELERLGREEKFAKKLLNEFIPGDFSIEHKAWLLINPGDVSSCDKLIVLIKALRHHERNNPSFNLKEAIRDYFLYMNNEIRETEF